MINRRPLLGQSLTIVEKVNGHGELLILWRQAMSACHMLLLSFRQHIERIGTGTHIPSVLTSELNEPTRSCDALVQQLST